MCNFCFNVMILYVCILSLLIEPGALAAGQCVPGSRNHFCMGIGMFVCVCVCAFVSTPRQSITSGVILTS